MSRYKPKPLYKDSDYVCSFESQFADLMNGKNLSTHTKLHATTTTKNGTLTSAKMEELYEKAKELEKCDFCKRKATSLYIWRNGEKGGMGQARKVHTKKMNESDLASPPNK